MRESLDDMAGKQLAKEREEWRSTQKGLADLKGIFAAVVAVLVGVAQLSYDAIRGRGFSIKAAASYAALIVAPWLLFRLFAYFDSESNDKRLVRIEMKLDMLLEFQRSEKHSQPK